MSNDKAEKNHHRVLENNNSSFDACFVLDYVRLDVMHLDFHVLLNPTWGLEDNKKKEGIYIIVWAWKLGPTKVCI